MDYGSRIFLCKIAHICLNTGGWWTPEIDVFLRYLKLHKRNEKFTKKKVIFGHNVSVYDVSNDQFSNSSHLILTTRLSGITARLHLPVIMNSHVATLSESILVPTN